MNIKKLAKPITIVIEINIKSYNDRLYGNTYSSARATVNRDYENELVLPIQYGDASHMETLVMSSLKQQYPRLEKLNKSDYYNLDGGFIVIVTSSYTTRRECKNFGGL